jgi:23S rRNA G2069 N7-methylase RlmK/C1962 C5-methylase RlmI
LAYAMRTSLGLVAPTYNNTYRLVHGEGDSLPGLIVDVYDDTAVMQAHSVGMHETREALAKAIVENVPEVKNVYYKSETTLVQSRTYDALVPLLSAAIFYLILVMILTYFMGKLERRLRKSDH